MTGYSPINIEQQLKTNSLDEVKRQLIKMYWHKPANSQPIHQPIAQKVITVIPFKNRYWLIG